MRTSIHRGSAVFPFMAMIIAAVILSVHCGKEKPVETDTSSPVVVITFPPNNTVVSEITKIKADANDNKGVEKVEFYIDGDLLPDGTDFSPPYTYSWNTISYSDSSVHTIFVKAYDKSNNIGSSPVISVVVSNKGLSPTEVRLERPVEITRTSVNLSWSQNEDEDFQCYKLYRSTSSSVDTNSTLVVSINQRSETSFLDASLTSYVTYYYRVFVFDRAGLSVGSNEVSAFTNSVPSPVTLDNPSDISYTSMTLTWSQNNDDDFESYRLYRATAPGVSESSTLVQTITDNTIISFEDWGLEDNTTYYYRIAVYGVPVVMEQ